MTDPLTREPVSVPPWTTATCRRPYCVLPMISDAIELHLGLEHQGAAFRPRDPIGQTDGPRLVRHDQVGAGRVALTCHTDGHADHRKNYPDDACDRACLCHVCL